MDWWQALLYGIIQGATEFLPVSSSGHLAIAHRMGLGNIPAELELAFDVLLHGASLVAIVIAFRNEILEAIRRGPRFWTLIFVGIVPAGLAGLLLKDMIDGFGDHLWLIASAYFYTAVLLLVAQYLGGKNKPNEAQTTESDASSAGEDDLQHITYKQAVVVGLLQVLALFPGVSRSGSTIAGGLLAGLSPKLAVTFSFLLGLPLIAAATAKDALDGSFTQLIDELGAVTVGVATISCLVVSYLCIALLKLVVARRQLHWFAIYCAILAVVLLILSFSQAGSAEVQSAVIHQ